MIWYFQDEILAHQQQYQAVFTSLEEEFWGTHSSSNHWKLWAAHLYSKVTPRCPMHVWGWTQDHSYTQVTSSTSCTPALISTASLNSGHQRASLYKVGLLTQPPYKHAVPGQTEAQQSAGTDNLSHTQDSKHRSTLHCHNLSHCYSCRNECSLLSHHHLNKAGEDELCRVLRKLAKERRLTGSSCILTFSCFLLFYLKSRNSSPIFKYERPVVFLRYNVNCGTCFLTISYHHKSLLYWETISTEVKATAVLEYWFTEN